MLKSIISILPLYFLLYSYEFLLRYFTVLTSFKFKPFITVNSYYIIGLIFYYIYNKSIKKSYFTIFYILWFVRINSYAPSSADLQVFIPIAKNIRLQSIADSLPESEFDNAMSQTTFIPLTSLVPASVNFILE